MHDQFQKDKPFFIRCNMSYENRSQTEQTQEKKEDNKQPLGKQHTNNQSEEDTSPSGEKGEKEEETGRKKRIK